ncbi:MAG: DUF1731 domain-containing protein [Actinomycetota bacterium]
MKVTMIGGSGFLGRELTRRLIARSHDVLVVGRGEDALHAGWRHVGWDARSKGSWIDAIDGSDVIVHLAGKRVDTRPTRANVDELIRSREGTVRLVGEAIADMDTPPTRWVQLSSLAIFGDAGDEVITEATPVPTDGPRQQVEVCRRWEAAFEQAAAGIDRRVLLRPAITIGGAGDPATAQLTRLARLGLGGPVAGGRQWVSWIGAEDMFDLLEQAVIDPDVDGLYHLASPAPATNAEMMAAYRAAVGRRFGVPSPAIVARVGAWLLGSDPALAITGRRCVPQRLLDEGHRFRSTAIDQAVAAAVSGTLGTVA